MSTFYADDDGGSCFHWWTTSSNGSSSRDANKDHWEKNIFHTQMLKPSNILQHLEESESSLRSSLHLWRTVKHAYSSGATSQILVAFISSRSSLYDLQITHSTSTLCNFGDRIRGFKPCNRVCNLSFSLIKYHFVHVFFYCSFKKFSCLQIWQGTLRLCISPALPHFRGVSQSNSNYVSDTMPHLTKASSLINRFNALLSYKSTLLKHLYKIIFVLIKCRVTISLQLESSDLISKM